MYAQPATTGDCYGRLTPLLGTGAWAALRHIAATILSPGMRPGKLDTLTLPAASTCRGGACTNRPGSLRRRCGATAAHDSWCSRESTAIQQPCGATQVLVILFSRPSNGHLAYPPQLCPGSKPPQVHPLGSCCEIQAPACESATNAPPPTSAMPKQHRPTPQSE